MRKVKQIVKQSVRGTGQGITKSTDLASKTGVPGEIRTLDPLLRRQPLYPPELQGLKTVVRWLKPPFLA